MASDPFPPLRIAGIEPESIVDGPGFRYVIFVQGCPHHCPGCHNPQTHDFAGGHEADPEQILREIRYNPLLRGVTFSGGEPFAQADALAALAARIREECPGKTLAVYSGFTLEQLEKKAAAEPGVKALLNACDLLIDGPFVLAKRDLSLRFRGSSNQRLIDLTAYRAGKADFLWAEDTVQ